MKNKYLGCAIMLLSVLTGARLALAGLLGLDGGPAYYAMWSRRLQLSYFDHPALTALLIRASTEVFGWNAFAVKLPAIILYLLTSIFMWRAVKLWKGSDRGAFYAVALFNFIPWMASSFGIKAANPDVPFLFCYMMAFYYFSKLYLTGNSRDWYLVGLWTAMGFAAKYNMVFVYPALLLCMCFMPRLKKEWRSPALYISAVLALSGMVPAIIWNLGNNFASFSYHLVERQGSFGIKPMQLVMFILNQIAIMGVFVPIMLFLAAWRERGTEVGKAALFFALPAIVAFSCAALFFGGAMQNWWACVYMIFLIVYGARREPARFDSFVLGLTAAVSIVGTIFYAYPFGIRLKETTSFLDHHLFDRAAARLVELAPPGSLIGTPRYRTTAMLAVHMPGAKIYSMDYRKGDQFQLWSPPSELADHDVIYVAGGSQAKQKPENLFEADSIELVDRQTYEYNPWFSRTFYFYKLKNYRGLK